MTRILKPVLGALVAGLLASACASTPTSPGPTAPVTFSREAFAWSAQPGRGRIEGRLVYNAKGVTYSCADVILTPETPWVRRRMEILYQSANGAVVPVSVVRSRTPSGGQDYSAFVRSTACNAGRFAFSGLADGAWFVITVGRPTPSGAEVAIMRRVVIRNGAAVKLDL
jgi:hypothetical protein